MRNTNTKTKKPSTKVIVATTTGVLTGVGLGGLLWYYFSRDNKQVGKAGAGKAGKAAMVETKVTKQNIDTEEEDPKLIEEDVQKVRRQYEATYPEEVAARRKLEQDMEETRRKESLIRHEEEKKWDEEHRQREARNKANRDMHERLKAKEAEKERAKEAVVEAKAQKQAEEKAQEKARIEAKAQYDALRKPVLTEEDEENIAVMEDLKKQHRKEEKERYFQEHAGEIKTPEQALEEAKTLQTTSPELQALQEIMKTGKWGLDDGCCKSADFIKVFQWDIFVCVVVDRYHTHRSKVFEYTREHSSALSIFSEAVKERMAVLHPHDWESRVLEPFMSNFGFTGDDRNEKYILAVLFRMEPLLTPIAGVTLGENAYGMEIREVYAPDHGSSLYLLNVVFWLLRHQYRIYEAYSNGSRSCRDFFMAALANSYYTIVKNSPSGFAIEAKRASAIVNGRRDLLGPDESLFSADWECTGETGSMTFAMIKPKRK